MSTPVDKPQSVEISATHLAVALEQAKHDSSGPLEVIGDRPVGLASLAEVRSQFEGATRSQLFWLRRLDGAITGTLKRLQGLDPDFGRRSLGVVEYEAELMSRAAQDPRHEALLLRGKPVRRREVHRSLEELWSALDECITDLRVNCGVKVNGTDIVPVDPQVRRRLVDNRATVQAIERLGFRCENVIDLLVHDSVRHRNGVPRTNSLIIDPEGIRTTLAVDLSARRTTINAVTIDDEVELAYRAKRSALAERLFDVLNDFRQELIDYVGEPRTNADLVRDFRLRSSTEVIAAMVGASDIWPQHEALKAEVLRESLRDSLTRRLQRLNGELEGRLQPLLAFAERFRSSIDKDLPPGTFDDLSKRASALAIDRWIDRAAADLDAEVTAVARLLPRAVYAEPIL